MSEPDYYSDLRRRFATKRAFAADALRRIGFQIYDSGSAFYIWARIPDNFSNARQLNELLISRGVAGVPGSAFADSEMFDSYMRFCIAREDKILQSALGTLQEALS
jgi:aspartate/methionine/tyrosine aminotransferase